MPANVRLSPHSDRSACRLDDASTMLNDFGIDERFFEGLEISKRAYPLGTHQTTVACDIRGRISCQAPLHVLAAQDARPSSWKLNGIYQNSGPMSRYAQVRNASKSEELSMSTCLPGYP